MTLRPAGTARLFLPLLLALLALSLPAAPAQANAPKVFRLLFINSYHRGYSWSDGIEQGLRERLAASGQPVEISYEYLDSRRFAYGSQMEHMARAMEIKYRSYPPDVVVVSDNAAFDFAKQYRDRLFPGIPLVFCGYNNFRPDVIQGMANVTGVNEEVSVPGAVELGLAVQPGTRSLAFVVSTGEASSARIAEIAEALVFPALRERFQVTVLKDASLEAIRVGLAALPRETLVFLCGQTSDQGAGRALSPPENGRLVSEVSPFPVYTFWDFHLGTGVIGGRILTGPDQGRAAAELVLMVLAGTPAGSIPVMMRSPTTPIFDYHVMERFGVSPASLPPGSEVLNRPFSLWHTYRLQIMGVALLVLVETVLILLLLRAMRGRRRALAALQDERSLLEDRVRQRTEELKNANEELAQLSFRDSLTRLANRRRFDEALETECLRHRRSGKPLSLILLDIDRFKDFNDRYGHIQGDECLRRIGDFMGRAAARAADLTARYGGEEFAVILPETGQDGATALAERIRLGIEALGMPHEASDVAGHVTASLGVATLPSGEQASPLELVRLADRQLYLAKSQGRNRVCAVKTG
ncbi:Phytochrome-like protein cph2 [Fundidesulfovibrio magnetotacticus]|uniref:diguanylate cyclase n=1 Tax=Fundidesulfovibrio magnetotacticus TaxID=2730080 RepID=A0A6V8LTC9_9BACT|nr:diguanylate cyclase [Fundidesulfovibrio magnetotacticus]GFK93578.1 Phytochrome-like protein cph2 [Fundidesulfovibrio magnetotacticus]